MVFFLQLVMQFYSMPYAFCKQANLVKLDTHITSEIMVPVAGLDNTQIILVKATTR
jgi:hypothetical protein